MFKHRRLALTAGLATVFATVVAASALATSQTVRTGSGSPVVYQTVHPCCNQRTLGPQSNPTTLGYTPVLAAGTYLVQYDVGVVMGPSDNVVCAADTSPDSNDGIFGTAGNGATRSGTGNNGVYGTAAATDTITVTQGQTIALTCNVGHFGQGTYTAGWTLTATQVGSLIKATL